MPPVAPPLPPTAPRHALPSTQSQGRPARGLAYNALPPLPPSPPAHAHTHAHAPASHTVTSQYADPHTASPQHPLTQHLQQQQRHEIQAGERHEIQQQQRHEIQAGERHEIGPRERGGTASLGRGASSNSGGGDSRPESGSASGHHSRRSAGSWRGGCTDWDAGDSPTHPYQAAVAAAAAAAAGGSDSWLSASRSDLASRGSSYTHSTPHVFSEPGPFDEPDDLGSGLSVASYGSPSLGVGSTPHDLESFDEDEQQHYTVHVQPLNRSVSANASYGYSGRGGGGGGSRDGISVDVRPQPHVRHHSTGGDGRGAGGDSGFARGWDGFEKVDVDGPGAGLEFDLVSGSSSGTPVATDGRTSVSASGWGAASGTEGQVYTDSDDGQDSGAGSPRQVGRRLGSRQARGRTPCGDDTVLMASVVVEAARADPGGGRRAGRDHRGEQLL